MLNDLDFVDCLFPKSTVVGASSAQSSSAVVVGPGVAAAQGQAQTQGTYNFSGTGAISAVTAVPGRLSSQATAWGTGLGQTGSNSTFSTSQSSGYASPGMVVLVWTNTQIKT